MFGPRTGRAGNADTFAVSRAAAILIRLVALAAFVALTNSGFVQRAVLLADQGRLVTALQFVGLWAFCLATLLIAAFQHNVWLRIFWALVIAITTAVGFSFRLVSGSELGILDAVSLWNARHEAARALDFYATDLPLLALVVMFGLLVMTMPPVANGKRLRHWLGRAAWTPALPVAVIAILIVVKEGGGAQVLPTQFAPLSVGIVAATKIAANSLPSRNEVTWKPGAAKIRKVVMLVDESVRGDYIDWIPGNAFTPELARLRDRLVDFGPAASGGNCSHYSNAILRFSAAPDHFGRQLLINPTLWQYAKAAGFRTVFIDSQAAFNKNPGKLQNFMTQDEVRGIDNFNAVGEGVSTSALDDRLLDTMLAELKSDGPVFIYATKNGAHFPYDRGYPETERRFQPTMSEALQAQVGGDVSRRNIATYVGGGSPNARVNSFRNVMRWSVDRFFKRLFEEADLRDTLILYTSDHGQAFNPDRFTHCTIEDPDPREALVPLFAITGDRTLREHLSAGAESSRNHASHFALVPTILDVLGYAKSDIATQYGPSLFEANTRPTAFTTGDIFGLFSDRVRWHEIDLSQRYLEPAAADPSSRNASAGIGGGPAIVAR